MPRYRTTGKKRIKEAPLPPRRYDADTPIVLFEVFKIGDFKAVVRAGSKASKELWKKYVPVTEIEAPDPNYADEGDYNPKTQSYGLLKHAENITLDSIPRRPQRARSKSI